TDLTHHIVRDYDVQADSGVAYRATFLIDPRGVVRSQLINDFPLSRNMDEILRLIDALQNQDLADSYL
ncbi:MAG TPA: redoxin domain-containing protein, partial [Pseudomonadales bacterium]|nr:redoxin domain-containing protein [Pseudomonadales bacterium]